MKYFAIVALVVVLVVGVCLWRRRQKAQGSTSAPSVGVTSSPASGGIFSKAISLNASGCAAVAHQKGLPSGLAQAGCSAWIKYATPLGQAKLALDALEHPEDTAKAIAGGVSKVGSSIATGVGDVTGALNSCSFNCPWNDAASARAGLPAIPTQFGLRDCARAKCSQKLGVPL